MPITSDNEFEKDEKKFYGTVLRRGYASSSIVKLLILVSTISYTIAVVCTVDSGFQGQARIALICALAWSMATFIAILVNRRKRMRDVLLSLGRCGDCGQKLTGSYAHKGRGITARIMLRMRNTLDRPRPTASIESIYRGH